MAILSKEVHNPSETLGKDRVQPPYNIGDRIAQAVILPYPQIEFEEGELTDSERGDGGFEVLVNNIKRI